MTEFVPADQVDPAAFDSAYFLEPASRSNRAYVLMREALQSTDRLAICTFTLRNRTRLCALRVCEDILMLQTLLWPDEIRPALLEGLEKEAKVRPQEVNMAASAFTVEEKDTSGGDDGDDEVAALRASVKDRGGDAAARDDEDDDEEDSGSGKKSSAKKSGSSSAKKASAKKTAAKRTPPRRQRQRRSRRRRIRPRIPGQSRA